MEFCIFYRIVVRAITDFESPGGREEGGGTKAAHRAEVPKSERDLSWMAPGTSQDRLKLGILSKSK